MEREQVQRCMRALGDPVRLEIFTLLRRGKLCACKILERFSMTQPTLSYHMKLLSEAGLVLVEKDWKWSHYSVNARTVAELEEFFHTFLREEEDACSVQT